MLGAEHPDTVRSMANLAGTYQNQGKLNEAELLQVQVMGMSKELLGAEQPFTLRRMMNLASTYENQGKWNEAEQLNIEVMNMKERKGRA